MPNPQSIPLDQALSLALQHHRAGRLNEAEAIYRQILATHPNHPDVLHLLGQLALQAGRADVAADLLGRATALATDRAEMHFDLGLALASLGRHEPAQHAFEDAVRLQPSFAQAHINLGVVLQAQQLYEAAIAAYERAIALTPESADAHYNLGTALRDAGRLEDAAAAFERAVSLRPQHGESLNNFGASLHRLGRTSRAVEILRRAVAIRPDFAEAMINLGDALQSSDDVDEAVKWYRRAIAIRPQACEAYLGLGAALHAQQRHAQAVAILHQAISIRPDYPEALNNLGNAQLALGQLDVAEQSYRSAISLRPNLVGAHVGLGSVLWRRGEVQAAIDAYQVALNLDPDHPEARNNLGTALLEQGHLDHAEQCYRETIQSNPGYALAHTNLGLLLLLRGNFEQGLPEHEWRLRTPEHGRLVLKFPQALWNGEDLAGKCLLLYAEQGLGDAIQFVRYLPLITACGARVILRCPQELARLFASLEQVQRLILPQDPLPEFDTHCSLLSLPHLMKTALDSIPANVPYLRADPAVVRDWRARIGDERRRKVGLVWAGRSGHVHDRRRSMSLKSFEAFAQLQNTVCFYSLQKGSASLEVTHSPIEMRDWTSDLHDLADTAALIDALDEVITVDTVVAHLAGALGKPVRLLLQHIPDWRWMLDRNDSPWYPTLRLYRQLSPGDWSAPVEKISNDLRGMDR